MVVTFQDANQDFFLSDNFLASWFEISACRVQLQPRRRFGSPTTCERYPLV
jgi:hypothetical protein